MDPVGRSGATRGMDPEGRSGATREMDPVGRSGATRGFRDGGVPAVLGQMLVAVLVAVLVAAVSLAAIAKVEWPAYNSSNQLHALTTVGQVVCLLGLLGAGLLWRRGRQRLAQL